METTAPISSQPAARPSLAALALQAAQSQAGQQEQPKGSNSGPMVDEYLAAVGLKPGYAWCQAFVYWCYRQAATQLGIACPVVKTGGVHDCWARTAAGYKIAHTEALHNPALVQPGTQLLLSYGSATGHTCLVESMNGNTINTIEGNSNTDGSREGYEVVRHHRSLTDSAILGFIKYA